MKKTLALVLALAMVFSTITVAFAEGTIGADAQICSDLGMLKGSTGTVDAAYVATAPTRIQAAVMFLRLKGLEADAMAFKGDANFADADTAAWAKPVMAYLKANPQLGWAGDGKNFNPTNTVTAKEYYKVLLETLGYKQNTAEVVGDFTWDNVITFAGEKGLTKVAAVTSYTVNDLAIATVEALKLNVKDTTKTLVASLVEAGKVDAAKATTAGIYAAAAAAKLDAVKSVANNKVELTFDADVAKAFAENASNYKVVVKGSTTALEVKAAVAESATVVALETAAQSAGVSYNVTVGDVTLGFTGLGKVTGAPEIDKVTGKDTNTIEVLFKKSIDKASAEDIANYSIAGLTVVKAELWTSVDDNAGYVRRTVKLTTEGMANNKVYTLKIANVKSTDGIAMKSVSKTFTGVVDTKAPSVSSLVVKNNHRLIVNFTDSGNHGVAKAALENMENFAIKAADGSELKITKLTAKNSDLDNYDIYEQLEIETESQTANTSYTLTMSNLTDGSVSANAIASNITRTFKGMAVDKTAPTVSVNPGSDTYIEIQFNDTNRLNYETATDVANYTFDKDITVVSATAFRSSKPDTDPGKLIILKTSAMEVGKTYKLTIANVADEFENVITTTSRTIVGQKEDITPPGIDSIAWTDLTHVDVTFNDRLDPASAEDPSNYVLSDLGAVVKAELAYSSRKIVTLTTLKQAENTNYTLTVTGVKDKLGNPMNSYKGYFSSRVDGVDVTLPTVSSVDVLSKQEIRVTFDEKVKVPTTSTLTLNTGAAGENQYGVYTSVQQLLDDETTVVYKATTTPASTLNPAVDNYVVGSSTKYYVKGITGVKDLANNTYVAPSSYADQAYAYGNDSANVAAELVTQEQTNVQRFKFTFNKPVYAAAGTITSLSTGGSTAATFNVTVDFSDENTTEAESQVTLAITGLTTIPVDKDFTFNFANIIKDYTDTNVTGETTSVNTATVHSVIEDKDAPVIQYVDPVNSSTIAVYYDEFIQGSAPGSYKIYDAEGKNVVSGVATTAVRDADDSTLVNVKITSGTLVTGDVYVIKPVTGAKDRAGNTATTTDISFSFTANGTAAFTGLKGVEIIDATHIRVINTVDMAGTEAFKVERMNGTTVVEDIFDAVTGVVDEDGLAPANPNFAATDTLVLTTTKPMIDGVTYKVSVATANLSVVGQSKVGGIVVGDMKSTTAPNDGKITFSGFDAAKYAIEVVYGGNTWLVIADSATATEVDANTKAYAVTSVSATGAYTLTDPTTAVPVLGANYTSIGTGSTYQVHVYRLTTAPSAYTSVGYANARRDGTIVYTYEAVRP